MTQDRTTLIAAGSFIGGLAGGVPGAVIGGIIGAIIATRSCPRCNSQMQSTHYGNEEISWCNRCGYSETKRRN
jgi:hypothetical protein